MFNQTTAPTNPLQQALASLLAVAPARIFPRARRLYFDKYPLEGQPASLDAAATPSRFRTFVLSECPGDAEPGEEAVTTSHPATSHPASGVASLAIVQWQAASLDAEAAATYLARQWQLQPVLLEPMPESWFRNGGAWARVSLPATGPAPAEAAP